MLETFDVWTPESGPPPKWPTSPVPGLQNHRGFRCTACNDGESFLTRSERDMGRHVSREHGQKPGAHRRKGGGAPRCLWEVCLLQTFYAETKHVRYFVVSTPATDSSSSSQANTPAPSIPPPPPQPELPAPAPAPDILVDGPGPDVSEEAFFRAIRQDAVKALDDAQAGANVMHGFEGHRSAVMPWLQKTGIPDHVRGLVKDEMLSSFALAEEGEALASGGGRVCRLHQVLEAMHEVMAESHRWCFDGPECRMTWQRQVALARFRTADISGCKLRGFEPKKEPATVERYVRSWKQCIAYYARVVHSSGHFTCSEEGQRTPEDLIWLSQLQHKA